MKDKTMRDGQHYSYYAYDHGGERRLKLTGFSTPADDSLVHDPLAVEPIEPDNHGGERPDRLSVDLVTNPWSTVEAIMSMANENLPPGNTSDEEPEVYFYHSDHLGSANWITDADGNPVQHLQYLPYGEPFVDKRMSGYNERFTFTGKERDEETGYGYFGARYMDHELMTMWLSVDPMADKYHGISPYHYCHWNPIYLIDRDGKKDRPFRHGIDKPKTFIENTSTPPILRFGGFIYANTDAYNCHSYAWHGGNGDPTPAPGDTRKVLGMVLPKWDNSPADDIIEKNAQQLNPNENNIPGDIVIYYMDSNGNGMYEDGEEIIHSAVVVEVDDDGYTTVVRAKCGESMISENHPDAPYYYDRYKGTKPSRAYFRIPENKDDSTNE